MKNCSVEKLAHLALWQLMRPQNLTGLSSITDCWDNITELKVTLLISVNILK
jgi:hypothetical protein